MQGYPNVDDSGQNGPEPAPRSTRTLDHLRIKIGSLRDAEQKEQPIAPPPAADHQESHGDVAMPRVRPPSVRDHLSPDLERELAAALGDVSLDSLMEGSKTGTSEGELPPESRVTGRVVAIHRENVFLELSGRNQGVVPLQQFDTPPAIGSVLEVMVHGFQGEEGLYELSLPGAAVDVGDWSQVAEGIIVNATVTGQNKGGLECRVGSLRAFVPLSQVSLYRVDGLEQFVGQSFPCVVIEANPHRRNLVLSRRAMLEREAAETKQKLWESLQVGQTREGVVRNLKDFGAFVDLGGVDGLIHVSQLSWDRVGHPSEVLKVGQRVRVKIEKIDRTSGRLSLAYRDLSESPWSQAAQKYPVSSRVKGSVTKIMEFGALVRLEPGISGMVHISELSHKRVWRVSDVVHEGQDVEALVLAVDPDAQRISLSLKALEARPVPQKKESQQDGNADGDASRGKAAQNKRSDALKGGLDRATGGDKFGLRW